MEKLSPVAKLTIVIMCIALVIVVAGVAATDVRSNDPPEQLTSSTFAIAPPQAGDPPDTSDALGTELDVFVYLPVAFQPELLSSFAHQVVEITNQERAQATTSFRIPVQTALRPGIAWKTPVTNGAKQARTLPRAIRRHRPS